jgi:hypothetical protein
MTPLLASTAALFFSAPAVLCGLLILALFVAIWFRQDRRRGRPLRKLAAGSALLVARVWGMRDAEAIYSAAQAVVDVGDTASTNVYDAGNAPSSDISMTEHIWFNVTVKTAFTSGGAGTLQVVLQDSADNNTFADVVVGPVFALAALVLGAVVFQMQPPVGLRRYTRLAYRVATAAMTAGKVDAYITSDIQRNVARPSGFTA